MSDSSCHVYANNSVLVILVCFLFFSFGTKPSATDVTCRNELSGPWGLAALTAVGHSCTAVTPGGSKSVLRVRFCGAFGALDCEEVKGGRATDIQNMTPKVDNHHCPLTQPKGTKHRTTRVFHSTA